MVKRFGNPKKDKPSSGGSGRLNKSTRVKTEQIGKKFINVIKVDENGVRSFDAKVGDIILVKRYQHGQEGEWDAGEIRGLEDDGTVKFWDDVREQWFFFNWKAKNIPEVIKRNA